MFDDREFLRVHRRSIHEDFILVVDHAEFAFERVILRQYETYAPAHREALTMPERHPAVYRRERHGWTRLY